MLDEVGADLAPLVGDVAPLEERLCRAHRRDFTRAAPCALEHADRAGSREPLANVVADDHAGAGLQELRTRARGGGRAEPRDRRRRARRPGRAVGLRQDHDAADDQPPDRADARAASSSTGRTCSTKDPVAHAPGHRLRHPAGRALPPPAGLRQRGGGAPPPRLGPGPGRAARATSSSSSSASSPSSYGRRFPHELSGGERQRVGVARALGADPPVLLMDEPFGAVDPVTRQRLQNQFLELQKQLKKSIVFVTHDIEEAAKLGDRIAVLSQGRGARAVRHAGRDPGPARDPVRGRLRGRRPRRAPPRRGGGSSPATWPPPTVVSPAPRMAEARALAPRRRAPRRPWWSTTTAAWWAGCRSSPAPRAPVGAHTEPFAATGAPGHDARGRARRDAPARRALGPDRRRRRAATSGCSRPTGCTPPCGARWGARRSSPKPRGSVRGGPGHGMSTHTTPSVSTTCARRIS